MILIALPLCCILLYSVIFKDGIRVFDFVLRLYKDFNISKRFARKKESLKAFQLKPISPDEVNLTPKLIRFKK